MDKEMYLREINTQLSDTATYQQVSANPTQCVRTKITQILHQYVLDGVIDSKTAQYIVKQDPITPVFHILPKVHKRLDNSPGCLIMASTDFILSPLAIYLDHT